MLLSGGPKVFTSRSVVHREPISRHLLANMIAVVFAGALSACAVPPRYQMSINTLIDPTSPSGHSFVVLPGGVGADTNDLQFLEVRGYMNRALRSRGFTPAASGQTPDLAVFVAYGIGDPVNQSYSYSMPAWGQIPGSTTSITATSTGASGQSTTTATATTAPRYGVVGSRQGTYSYTTFTRYLVVRAVDVARYRESGVVREAWHTAVVSTGSSGDLRAVLPILIAGSSRYLGSNTGQAVSIALRENDELVQSIREGPLP
jgi:hypothetical protein